MRQSATGRSTALLGFAFLVLSACTGAPGTIEVERTDSAGVEIVTSPAEGRTLAWTYVDRFSLGGADGGPESFYRLAPSLLDVDSAGRIHVLHAVEHQVVSFGPDGTLLRAVGGQGEGPGELERPANLAATPAGGVSVYDYGKAALVRWGPDGDLLAEMRFPLRPMLGGQHHALTADGYLVSTGGLVDGERANRLLAVAGEDTTLLAAAPQPNQGMVRFESCGGGINFPPLFTPFVQWDHRDGLTAVVAGDDYRVDLWRDGEVVRSVRRPISGLEATRELAIAEAGEGFRIDFGRGPCTVPPDEYADARGWAATVPAIHRIRLGPDGELWVERWVPGRSPMPIDVFSADGAYLGTLPDSTELPVVLMQDRRVGLVRTDDVDVDRLVVADVLDADG